MPSTEPAQDSRAERLDGNRVSQRGWTAALLAVTILSLVLRVIAIGSKSVFADEFASFQFAKLDWRAFCHLVATREANMALYYVVLRLWIAISDNISFVRFLSVIPAVATVPVIYAIGKRLLSRPAAILASILFALNTFDIYYSQSARSYSWAVFLVAVSCWLFVEEICDGGTPKPAAYIAVCTAALYTHLFSVFIIGAQFISIFFLSSRRHLIMPWLRRMMAIGALALPLVIFAAIHKTAPLFWVPRPTIKDVYHLVTYMAGSGLKLGLSFVAIVVAIRELWQRSRSQALDVRRIAWPFIFLALWAAVPAAIVLLLSQWKPVFSPRFFLPSLPAVALLIAEGIVLLRPRWLRYGFVGILICAWLTALPAYYRSAGIEDWRAVAGYLSGNVLPGDIVVVQPEFQPVLHLSSTQYRMPLASDHIVDKITAHDLLTTPEHIWVVFCHPQHAAADAWPLVPSTYKLVSWVRFVGIDVREYTGNDANRK